MPSVVGLRPGRRQATARSSRPSSSWRTRAIWTGGASNGAGAAAAAALALALGAASLALGWALGLAPVDGAELAADWEQAVATRATARPRAVSAPSRRGGWVYGSLLDTRVSKAAGMGGSPVLSREADRTSRQAGPTSARSIREADRRRRVMDLARADHRRHQNASPRVGAAVSATTTCHASAGVARASRSRIRRRAIAMTAPAADDRRGLVERLDVTDVGEADHPAHRLDPGEADASRAIGGGPALPERVVERRSTRDGQSRRSSSVKAAQLSGTMAATCSRKAAGRSRRSARTKGDGRVGPQRPEVEGDRPVERELGIDHRGPPATDHHRPGVEVAMDEGFAAGQERVLEDAPPLPADGRRPGPPGPIRRALARGGCARGSMYGSVKTRSSVIRHSSGLIAAACCRLRSSAGVPTSEVQKARRATNRPRAAAAPGWISPSFSAAAPDPQPAQVLDGQDVLLGVEPVVGRAASRARRRRIATWRAPRGPPARRSTASRRRRRGPTAATASGRAPDRSGSAAERTMNTRFRFPSPTSVDGQGPSGSNDRHAGRPSR